MISQDSTPIIHGPVRVPAEVPTDWLNLALNITMAFEGTSWGTVAGNFDGMGISVGILQWNYGQGSLQTKILQPYINRFGTQDLDACFGVKVSESAYLSPKEAVAWAKKNLLHEDGFFNGVRKFEWTRFLRKESVVQIQKEAAHSIASKAFHDARENNLLTARSFCWFFDVYVQNGSLNGITKPELSFQEKIKTMMSGFTGRAPQAFTGPLKADLSIYQQNLLNDGGENLPLWMQIKLPSDECQMLFNWICERAVKNRWRADVIARKGTIAHGIGRVHGKLYDLNQEGLE